MEDKGVSTNNNIRQHYKNEASFFAYIRSNHS